MRELHLFAGGGGGILGSILLGHTCVCAVEIEPYAREELLQRQRDGLLPKFPIWDDIRTFDGRPWRRLVDVVCGGFPCTDISGAGKGAGIAGPKSGLWKEMARVGREVGARHIFIENSPFLTKRGLGIVLGDLAEMGYDAEWGVFGTSDAIFLAGDPEIYHDRFRIFILASANSDSLRKLQPERCIKDLGGWVGDVGQEGADPNCDECHWGPGSLQVGRSWSAQEIEGDIHPEGNQWSVEPPVGRLAYGVANRLEQLRILGNGQVPAVVALAWRTLFRKRTK